MNTSNQGISISMKLCDVSLHNREINNKKAVKHAMPSTSVIKSFPYKIDCHCFPNGFVFMHACFHSLICPYSPVYISLMIFLVRLKFRA